MIMLENVTKIYKSKDGHKVVADDLSCQIPRGCNLGILGINGAGKSTLLRMIGGIEEPNSGVIRRHSRVSFPLGFSGTFAGSLSGRENAVFLARIYGASTRYVVDFAEDFAEIGSYYDMPVNTYSSGMRSRLAFGVSLAIDFDVYLVDEATAVGDVTFQEKCHAAISARFSRSDVIMISHAPETLKQYCNQGAVLDRGRLAFYDDIDQANAAYLRDVRASKRLDG
jgi:capsular polysaccharide transport system ATP-binding protein